jgi:hypothetical protein
MTIQKQKNDGSTHMIIELDSLHENEIPRKQSSVNREQVIIDRNRMSRIPHYNKWMSGRSVVTLHR